MCAWGAVGSLLADVGGNMLSTYANARINEKAAHEQMDFTQAQQFKNDQLQREFAQNGVSWRVEDAKRAGLHPLAALGAGSTSYSPVSVGYTPAPDKGNTMLAAMGQNISRAARATMTDEQRTHNELQLAVLRSQIGENDARAAYYHSEAARNAQSSLSTAAMAPAATGAGQVTIQPDQKISESVVDSSRTAGKRHPFWKQYEIFPGVQIDIPYSQEGPAEGMEGTGALAATLLRNFGYRPYRWFKKRVLPHLPNHSIDYRRATQ